MSTDSTYEESDETSIKSVSEKTIESIDTISESIFDTWREDDVNELTNNIYQLLEE